MHQSTRNPDQTHPSASGAATPSVAVREFEADTVEDALEQVTTTLGLDARIVDVEKVARGGVGGFFAREAVIVRATPPASPQAAPPSEASVKHARAGGIDAVLTHLAAEQDAAERDFRARLDQQLQAQAASEAPAFERLSWPAVAPAESAGPPASTAPAPEAVVQDEVDDADVEVVAAPAPPAPPAATRPALRPVERLAPTPRQLPAPTRAIAPALPSPRPSAAPTDPVPAGAGPVQWSATNLQRIGLPASVVDAVWTLRSDDDFVWLRAVADAVKLFCRPLPMGASMLAGPRAKRLAEALDLPAVKRGEAPPYGGHVGIQCKDHKNDRAWLKEVAGERWLHVVLGGHGWQGLLFDDPLAVSWVGDEELPEALDLCAKLGLVLGYGMAGDTRDAVALRATPFEVALAIRTLLPRT